VFFLIKVDFASFDTEDAKIDGFPDNTHLRQNRTPEVIVQWIVSGQVANVFSQNSLPWFSRTQN
jgi:hypothetical protein